MKTYTMLLFGALILYGTCMWAMEPDEQEIFPLHCAASEDNHEFIETLIRYRCNVDTRDAENKTPLMDAVASQHTKSVKTLIDLNANINATTTPDDYMDPKITFTIGKTPLVLAIINKNYSMMKTLLEYNADPNMPNSSGWRPLHCAIYNDFDTKAIKLLKKYGANERMPYTDNWKTAAQHAQDIYNKEDMEDEFSELIPVIPKLQKEFIALARSYEYKQNQRLSEHDVWKIIALDNLKAHYKEDSTKNPKHKKRLEQKYKNKKNKIETEYKKRQAYARNTPLIFAISLGLTKKQVAKLLKSTRTSTPTHSPKFSRSPELIRKSTKNPRELRRTQSSPALRKQPLSPPDSPRPSRKFKD